MSPYDILHQYSVYGLIVLILSIQVVNGSCGQQTCTPSETCCAAELYSGCVTGDEVVCCDAKRPTSCPKGKKCVQEDENNWTCENEFPTFLVIAAAVGFLVLLLICYVLSGQANCNQCCKRRKYKRPSKRENRAIDTEMHTGKIENKK
mmetsp:Transcript_62006/g.71092  ORF Transcript_62006/g.71092 Transcript_62006/m.71092 type:complete len:148 (+) Transcript_62006:62-505(+)